jgi:hypothetical protein
MIACLPGRTGSKLAAFALSLLALSGCPRNLRPDAGPDRTVETGVPLSFGSAEEKAPAVRWDFGDGSAPVEAARAEHAFHRAGTYEVRALDGKQTVASAKITVVPRPALRAVPADAEAIFWVPKIRGNAEPLIRIGSEMFGNPKDSPALLQYLEAELAPDTGTIDGEEGLGVFALPGVDGAVAFLGVTDPERAQERVLASLRDAGEEVIGQFDGVTRVLGQGGDQRFVFADRGYLYLVQIDASEEGVLAEAAEAPAIEVRSRVRALSGGGLSESPLLASLRNKAPEGNAYLFARLNVDEQEVAEAKEAPKPGPEEALFLSVMAKERQLELDGFLSTELPFALPGAAGVRPFSKAPLGPVVAAYLGLPPESWARMLLGAPGSKARAERAADLREEGIDAEAVLAALRGDVSLLAYFDAPEFYRAFFDTRKPQPKGALRLEVGVREQRPMVDLLRAVAADTDGFRERTEGKTTRFEGELFSEPMTMTVEPERAVIELGRADPKRPVGDLGAALSEGFGGKALEAGSLFAMVDLGRVRKELASVDSLEGDRSFQLVAARAFIDAMLTQLTRLDRLSLRVGPESGGARIRASLILRPE